MTAGELEGYYPPVPIPWCSLGIFGVTSYVSEFVSVRAIGLFSVIEILSCRACEYTRHSFSLSLACFLFPSLSLVCDLLPRRIGTTFKDFKPISLEVTEHVCPRRARARPLNVGACETFRARVCRPEALRACRLEWPEPISSPGRAGQKVAHN